MSNKLGYIIFSNLTGGRINTSFIIDLFRLEMHFYTRLSIIADILYFICVYTIYQMSLNPMRLVYAY